MVINKAQEYICKSGDTKYIYKNELDKACFQYDMAHGDFKDLARRTAADRILRNKPYKIAKDSSNTNGYQKALVAMVYKFFDKKATVSGIKSIPYNEQLAKELHKPIIKRFEKRKVYSAFKDNIWGADLADMQLISKFNKRFRFFLCVIDI